MENNYQLDVSALSMEDIYELLADIEREKNLVITCIDKEDFTRAVQRVLPQLPSDVADVHVDEYWDDKLRDEIADAYESAPILLEIAQSTLRDSIANVVGIKNIKEVVRASAGESVLGMVAKKIHSA